jgi:dienelactone hydrolase
MRQEIYPKTATFPAWFVILPDGYDPAKRYPVIQFQHGIGESGNKKTITSMSAFGGYAGLRKAADEHQIISVHPQNPTDTQPFPVSEVKKVFQMIKEKYSDGRVGLWGLSHGGMCVLNTMADYAFVNQSYCSLVPICPGNYEAMNEWNMAKALPSTWIFGGGVDTAVTPARLTNTVHDLIKAGKKNLYYSVYPNDDHIIWPEVLGATQLPPVTPSNGAKQWSYTDTDGKIYTVPCVNDPAQNVYTHFLAQKIGLPMPLKRLSDSAPVPVPPPPTGEAYYSEEFIYTGDGAMRVHWTDTTSTSYKIPAGDTVEMIYQRKLNGRPYIVLQTKGGIRKVYGPKKI